MMFTIFEGILDEVAEKALPFRRIRDSEEQIGRLLYILVELCVYIGFPVLLFWALSQVTHWSIAGGFAVLIIFLPDIKLFLGRYGKHKDPRLNFRSSSFFFDGFLFLGSPCLRDIRRYSALSRSLDIIYNSTRRFGIDPAYPHNESPCRTGPSVLIPIKKLIELHSKFWLNMPVARDVRSRLEIIAEEYRKKICSLAALRPGRKIAILEVAGGQLQATIMGIKRAIDYGAVFDYEVVSIEPDDFGNTRAVEVIKEYGLDISRFTFIQSKISTNEQRKERHIINLLKENGKNIHYDMVTCIGLSDYYFSSCRLQKLLMHLSLVGSGAQIIVANIQGNYFERRLLHKFINWPRMRYRNLREWGEELVKAFQGREAEIIQTPMAIFNVAVIR
jgi:hypothetical protein